MVDRQAEIMYDIFEVVVDEELPLEFSIPSTDTENTFYQEIA